MPKTVGLSEHGNYERVGSATVSGLQVSALGKEFRGPKRALRTAVESIDLEVSPGEIVGLLGPNGAGKTTTISMIGGILAPTRGEVWIAGHSLRTEKFAARRNLGLVPQEIALYEAITARQNLAFFARLYGVARREIAARIASALEVAGLSDRADEPVSQFSGGMKRRLNLVAGLLHEPKVLVCDEPTVGVDPQSRRHIFDALRDAASRGTAIVYTSHYLEEVQDLCRRVVVMDHGRVLVSSTVDDLLRSASARRMELEVRGNVAAISLALAPFGGVSVGGTRFSVPAVGSEVGAIMRALEEANSELVELVSDRPNLESVFLALTGHGLRDG